jgi:hypothetical protein
MVKGKSAIMVEIRRLWQEHCAVPFPAGCAGKEVDGICLVFLDSFAAGCIASFIAGDGHLDSTRAAVLRESYQQLTHVCDVLDGDANEYCRRLEKLAGLVEQELPAS